MNEFLHGRGGRGPGHGRGRHWCASCGGPGDADRVMAAQLLGTGGVAALLLAGIARGRPATLDVALTLAVLAAFASIAFVKGAAMRQDGPRRADDDP